jgi:hypothetical protein
MYVDASFFRVAVEKRALMQFLANVPAKQYCFVVIPNTSWIYACFLSNDCVEYLTNECLVQEIVSVPKEVIRKAAETKEKKLWSNEEILYLLTDEV